MIGPADVVGRGAGVGRGRGVGVCLGVAVGVGVGVGVIVGVTVGVGVGVGGEARLAMSLPRVSSWRLPSTPPQTIISLPVQTVVEEDRALGAFVVLVGVQLFEPGLYLPPVFNPPPQMIISVPVQTAV